MQGLQGDAHLLNGFTLLFNDFGLSRKSVDQIFEEHQLLIELLRDRLNRLLIRQLNRKQIALVARFLPHLHFGHEIVQIYRRKVREETRVVLGLKELVETLLLRQEKPDRGSLSQRLIPEQGAEELFKLLPPQLDDLLPLVEDPLLWQLRNDFSFVMTFDVSVKRLELTESAVNLELICPSGNISIVLSSLIATAVTIFLFPLLTGGKSGLNVVIRSQRI